MVEYGISLAVLVAVAIFAAREVRGWFGILRNGVESAVSEVGSHF